MLVFCCLNVKISAYVIGINSLKITVKFREIVLLKNSYG